MVSLCRMGRNTCWRQGTESMPKNRFDPVDVAVGNRIRVQRLLSDMSQSALGEAIRVTFQQVQKYEKGANRVGASRLTQIAKALGVPIKTFFDGSDEEVGGPKTGTAFEFLAVPGALDLVRAYAQIARQQAAPLAGRPGPRHGERRRPCGQFKERQSLIAGAVRRSRPNVHDQYSLRARSTKVSARVLPRSRGPAPASGPSSARRAYCWRAPS